jgi:4-aminobutyrate aminotransferase / (S)-3-amino-2-methylpropionate transaminase / 5-aminovalerate transaminase
MKQIVTELPAPESVQLLDALHAYEPAATNTQLPTVWDRAEGVHIFDPYGNVWLDWTSGVLTANAGHAPASVVAAVCDWAKRPLLHAYSWPSQLRAEFVTELCSLTGFEHVIPMTSGAETVEAAVKLARCRRRGAIVSFDGAFHGRTMATQVAGGIAQPKRWTAEEQGVFVRVPFPSDDSALDISEFEALLEQHDVHPADTAAVLLEPYQGSTLRCAVPSFVHALRTWCDDAEALLIFDEIQSGFGRTGTLFAYERFDIRPDILCCGKGISSGLPLSTLLFDGDLGVGIGDLSTTHGGNPLSLAAGLATLRLFRDGTIVAYASAVGEELQRAVRQLVRQASNVVASPQGAGHVTGFTVICNGEPSATRARFIVEECWRHGLLMFTPIGPTNAIIKIAPPLITTRDELQDGLQILTTVIKTLSETAAEGSPVS